MSSQPLNDAISPAAYVIQPIGALTGARPFEPYDVGCKPSKSDPVDAFRTQYAAFARQQVPPSLSLADSPVKDPKSRKCRDIACLVIFFVAWIAAIVLIIWQKMFAGANSKATAMLMHSDSLRRICGQGANNEQLDRLASDFGRVVQTAEEMRQLCTDVQTTAPTGLVLSVACADIVKDGKIVPAQARRFAQQLRPWNRDQHTNFAVQTADSFVCVQKRQDCDPLAGKAYACHAEVKEVISKVFAANSSDFDPLLADFPYLTENNYANIKTAILQLQPASEYLLRLCEPMGSAYKYNSMLEALGGQFCEIDYTGGSFGKKWMVAYVQYYFKHIVGEFVAEISQQYWTVIAGVAVGIVLMALYTVLLQFISQILIWGTVVLLFALMIWGQVDFYMTASAVAKQMDFVYAGFGYRDQDLQKTYDWYMALAVILTIIEVVLLILLIIFFKAIRIAAGVIGASMSAARKMWFVFLLPLLFVVLAALHAAWSITATYLYYTSGSYDARLNQFDFLQYVETDGLFEPRTEHDRLCIYVFMIFVCVWGFFIVYCCMEYLISALVVQWYFTYYKKAKMPHALRQAILCLFKSFGTVLATSFITALVVVIRWLFEYFLKRMEQANRISDNKVVRAAIWFTRCCLRCLNKFVQWINRNVYIVAAISGDGYCASTKKALQLILGNFISSIGVKGLAKFFLFLGEVLVVVAGGVVAYFCVRASEHPNMLISPIVLTIVISYVVSFYAMHIVEIIVDTVYLCFYYERCYLLKEKEAGSRTYAPPSLACLL